MGTGFSEALARPDLLRNLVWAELSARYKTTVFGILWFLANPLLMMVILVIVFKRVVNLEIPNYPAFVLSALLPWAFFSMSMNTAANSLSRASGLVKRVRIPREYVPLSALLAGLVHFGISLVMLFAFMYFERVRISPMVIFLPAVMMMQIMFLTGACLLVASLNVLYRDVEQILGPIIQSLFYFTPTFYPLSYVPKQWMRIYLLNPMAGITELYRDAVVAGWPAQWMVVKMSVLMSVIFLVGGFLVFRRLEPHFDDYI